MVNHDLPFLFKDEEEKMSNQENHNHDFRLMKALSVSLVGQTSNINKNIGKSIQDTDFDKMLDFNKNAKHIKITEETDNDVSEEINTSNPEQKIEEAKIELQTIVVENAIENKNEIIHVNNQIVDDVKTDNEDKKNINVIPEFLMREDRNNYEVRKQKSWLSLPNILIFSISLAFTIMVYYYLQYM